MSRRSAAQRSLAALAFVLCTLLSGSLLLSGQSAPVSRVALPVIVHLAIRDTIQPVSAQYLHRGLAEAASRNAALVILTLDTPGGLLTSTRAMVADLEASPVPVAVLIAPTGARAGSAGFFLLEAADIAAMAPGTNAGAAHPVLAGRTLDPVLNLKIENDAAAFLRSFVSRRGRNAQAAEDAVRNSKSYSDAECVQLHLIDYTAQNGADLAHILDGKTVRRFNGDAAPLLLTNAVVETISPSLRESFLTRLADPDLAVLLLFAGVMLIYAEFNLPGTIIPGSLGALLVMLALFGLNLLPVRHTAVGLLLAGFVLMLLEFKVASHGVLAFSGIAALVVGLLTLVDGPIPEMRVHPGTAIAVGASFGLISFVLTWLALLARRNKSLLGPNAMIGRIATAHTLLAPVGQVEVRGELWQAALAEGASASVGTHLIVQAVQGLRLLVGPLPGNSSGSPANDASAAPQSRAE